MTGCFAGREEKQILRYAQDDMSFRAKHSGARNLLLVASLCRAASIGNHQSSIANRQSSDRPAQDSRYGAHFRHQFLELFRVK